MNKQIAAFGLGTLAAWVLSSGIALADGAVIANGVRVLKAFTKCPETEPTCMVFHIDLVWPKERSSRITEHPNVVRFVPDNKFLDYGTAHVNVRGRLKGGPEKKYRLLLSYPTDALGCGEFYAATVGVSGKTGGTILTDAGRLEIVDETLKFGDRSSVKFIDKKDLTASGRLSPNWERYSWGAKPVITKDGKFYLKKQDHCISVETPGLFQLIPADQCIPLPMDDVSPLDMEKVRKAHILSKYGNERLKYDLYQPRGAPFLVRIWGVACT